MTESVEFVPREQRHKRWRRRLLPCGEQSARLLGTGFRHGEQARGRASPAAVLHHGRPSPSVRPRDRITPIAAATPWLLLEHETGSATISALTRWRARGAASRSSPRAVSRGAPGLPRLRIACSPINWILASASPTWTPPFGRKRSSGDWRCLLAACGRNQSSASGRGSRSTSASACWNAPWKLTRRGVHSCDPGGAAVSSALELPRFRRHLNASGRKPGKVRFRCPELGRRIPRSSIVRRSV